MTQDNLIAKDVQSLELADPILDLFELEYSDTTTLYFHPGKSTTVRVIKVNGATITLNTAQTLSNNSSLTFTGVNNYTGVEATITALVNAGTNNSQTVAVDTLSGANSATTGWKGEIEVGMVVTGTDIVNHNFGPVVFDGNTYYGFPIGMDALEISNDGAMHRPVLSIANIESVLRTSSTFQNAFNSEVAGGGTASGIADFKLDRLVGKRLVRRRTLEKYLHTSTASATKDIIEFPKASYVIDRIADRSPLVVTIELASPFDLAGIRIPSREVIGKYCNWIYKGKNEYTSKILSGTVYINSGTLTTLRGNSTVFSTEIAVGDEIIIDGKYIRKVTAKGTGGAADNQLTVATALPIITNNGGSASSDPETEPGPLTFAKITRKNKGACAWRLNGNMKQKITGTNRTFKVFYTINDEPIIFKGVTHTYASGSWSVRTGSQTDPAIAPKVWDSSGTDLTKMDVVTTSDGLHWLYLGEDNDSVTTVPVRNHSSWQLIRYYTGWTDRAYTINTTDALNNDYVLYPLRGWDTINSVGFVETAQVWRNTVSLPNSSGEKPSSDSLFWAPGDVCGKLLMSCKKRYQYLPRVANGSDENTVPHAERDTNALLPFGGFPGSKKFR